MTLAFAALSVLAFGSFYASRNVFRGAKPETPPATPSVRNGPLPTQNPAVQPIPVPPRESTAPPADANPEETPPDLQPWDKLQTIRFQKVHLQDALRAIAGQSGLQLEIAPGMPNPLIQADYRGMTGLEILADMGPQFGFTAFHQGEGQVIVIPARDATGDAPNENRTDAPDANTKLQPTRNDKPGE